MATFDELLIQGIRSYSPNKPSVIKFLHPLTIIEGVNGAGKTTIIECLANVCCGSLPAGQKQAFLHSLERTKTTRVDAQIKLAFHDKGGREIVATSRMTNYFDAKEKKAQTKTDEQTLLLKETSTDRRMSMSSKQADFYREVTLRLGIPKSILENVIFCHQENATWPLSEPKILKSKFDDIFQLTMYVKFVENVREKLKKIRVEADIASAQAGAAATLYNERTTKERRKMTLERLLAENEKKMNDIQKKINDGRKKTDAMTAQIDAISKQLNEKSMMEASLSQYQQHRSMISCPEWKGTEEELKKIIKELESSSEYRSAEQERVRIESRLGDLERELKWTTQRKREAEEEMTKTKALQLQRDRTARELDALVENVGREYGIRVAHADLLARLEALTKERGEEAQWQLEKLAQDERTAREAFEAANNDLLQLEMYNSQYIAEHEKINREIAELNQRLGALSDSQNELPELKSQQDQLEEELKKRGVPPTRDELKLVEADKKALALEVTRLKEVISSAAKWEEVQKERERLTSERDTAKAARDALVQKHHAEFMAVFAKIIDGPIAPQIDQAYATIGGMLKEDRGRLAHADVQLDRATTAVRTMKAELETLQEEEREIREKIAQCTGEEGIDEEDVEWRHEQSMATVKSFRSELAPMEASATLYSKWSEVTRSTKCCPLCERDFRDKKQAEQLADKLANMSLSVPDEARALSARLEQQEEEEKMFAKAVNYVEQLRAVQKKMHDVQDELKQAEADCKEKTKAAKTLKLQVDKFADMFDNINKLKADVSLMDAQYATCERAEATLQAGEREWRKEGRAKVKTAEKERDHLRKVEEELASHTSRLDALLLRVSEVNRITTEINDLRKRALSLDEDIIHRGSMEDTLQKREGEKKALKEKMKEGERRRPMVMETLQKCKTELSAREEKRKAATAENEKSIRGITDKRDRYVTLSAELQMLEKGADATQWQSVLTQCDTTLTQLNARQAQCTHELTRVGETQTQKQTLDAQLQLLSVSSDIVKLEQKLKKLDPVSDADVHKLTHELERQRQQSLDATKELGALEGTMKTHEEELTDILIRLDHREMLNSVKGYVEALSKKMVREHAYDDLERYAKQLEYSMLDFHKRKMAEVNYTLDDLWRSTYRGGDIDSIRVQSDQSIESESGKRKSYNYKVMMLFPDGKEEDMRDRCSAGQKMLACLLIRIALADVFGSHCSTLALDEPTTNLDSEKVEHLADSLIELIARRTTKRDQEKGGKGLQLIVITHDLRLVERLRRSIRPEFMYHLTKDENAYTRLVRVYQDGLEALETASAAMELPPPKKGKEEGADTQASSRRTTQRTTTQRTTQRAAAAAAKTTQKAKEKAKPAGGRGKKRKGKEEESEEESDGFEVIDDSD